MPIVRDYGYGFFPGGDPRNFSPDGDATPEELENHRQACAAWDAGAHESSPDCIHGQGFIITHCQFGLGTYHYDEDVGWLDWIRYYVWPEARGAMWRWWHFDMLPGMREAWR